MYASMLCGVLGALGREFESCRLDHLKTSHTKVTQRLAFLLDKYDHKQYGQITNKCQILPSLTGHLETILKCIQ